MFELIMKGVSPPREKTALCRPMARHVAGYRRQASKDIVCSLGDLNDATEWKRNEGGCSLLGNKQPVSINQFNKENFYVKLYRF